MQKFPMTVAGHAALETELKHLKSVERPYIINAISVARDHGDLSENAEYHAAKEKKVSAMRLRSWPPADQKAMKFWLSNSFKLVIRLDV